MEWFEERKDKHSLGDTFTFQHGMFRFWIVQNHIDYPGMYLLTSNAFSKPIMLRSKSSENAKEEARLLMKDMFLGLADRLS